EPQNGGTQYIASGQAFFVRANDSGAQITFSEEVKSEADGNSFFRKSDPQDVLRVNLVSSNNNKLHQDEIVLRLKSEATDNFDQAYDAYKLVSGWMNMYSLTPNEEK